MIQLSKYPTKNTASIDKTTPQIYILCYAIHKMPRFSELIIINNETAKPLGKPTPHIFVKEHPQKKH